MRRPVRFVKNFKKADAPYRKGMEHPLNLSPNTKKYGIPLSRYAGLEDLYFRDYPIATDLFLPMLSRQEQ